MNSVPTGKIVTFYSFKGGVGRTMALANVAFLAAANGLKVLTIDWDLEAPGLSYYFRGLGDQLAINQRPPYELPGVLDLLCAWQREITAAKDEGETDRIIQSYKDGLAFPGYVHSAVSRNFLPPNGSLDFIHAGRKELELDKPVPYERALADFSWRAFFDEYGGGVLLQAFRDWAKTKYDLVFIDSRTGLADAAGVCTLQLPDEVVLCFVLNRQNIDGVSRVAASIRSQVNDRIVLHAAPMRVSRQDTGEESDARANALTQLTRIGGFPPSFTPTDLNRLAIPAAENIPFYEAISLVVTPDPKRDPLVLAYQQLCDALVPERELGQPSIDPALLAQARARLQPRQATADYLERLKSADPTRASEEFRQLLRSAQEDIQEGDPIRSEYVNALIAAATSFTSSQRSEFFFDLTSDILNLLRTAFRRDPINWREPLASIIEWYLDEYEFGIKRTEVIALLNELGELSKNLTDPISVERFIRSLTKITRINLADNNISEARRAIEDIDDSLRLLAANSSLSAQLEPLTVLKMRCEWHLLAGDVNQAEAAYDQALLHYQEGLHLFNTAEYIDNPALRRVGAEIHERLSFSYGFRLSESERATHSLMAATLMHRSANLYYEFHRFAEPIINNGSPALTNEFCEAVFGFDKAESLYARFFALTADDFGRNLDAAIKCLQQISILPRDVADPNLAPVKKEMLEAMASLADASLRFLLRPNNRTQPKEKLKLLPQIQAFKAALEACSFEWSPSKGVIEMILNDIDKPRIDNDHNGD